MSSRSDAGEFGVAAFRLRLLAAMTLVVVSLTMFGVYLIERSVTAETEHDLEKAFVSEIGLLRTVREIRHASLMERCRHLVRKPRIHAALEDDALDLLYPSARDELGEVGVEGRGAADSRSTRPIFYRFLDSRGSVIRPVNVAEVGDLAVEEESRLGFSTVPRDAQTGYFARPSGEIIEVIVTPIISTETGESIAALVAGFSMTIGERRAPGLRSGLWAENRIHLPTISEKARADLARDVSDWLADGHRVADGGRAVMVDGAEHFLFCELLNSGSLFPPAYEIGIYPLAGLLERQWQLRWNAAGAGLVLLMLGFAASLYISERLAKPVRRLAEVSRENRVLRDRAEAALELKRAELERTARFSANASHQLKTPVAVLRAGLDELMVRSELSDEVCEEISLLIHQTFRLTSIIEDLMLLSQLDSGRLQLSLAPIALTRVVETCVEDLRLAHEGSAPEVELDVPSGLHIVGDMRYTMLIVQNLVENACKYGRRDFPIRLAGRESGAGISLTVANRGAAIPSDSWEQIFERFHRAAVGENIPGHGLGLNLARELARLHGGDVTLLQSDGEWTVFEARFRGATVATPAVLEPA